METLRFAMLQFATRLDDPAADIERIIACGAAHEVDLLVTPEQSLTGYDLGDLASHLAVPVRVGEVVPGCDRRDRASAVVIAGVAERGDDEVAYNALVAMKGGRVLYKHRKIHLPTYGMFDEARFWGRGRGVDIWEYAGWRPGLIVCEDFWHPGLVYALAHRNIQILVVAAAAPGRGMRADAGPGRFASTDAWTAIARSTAQLFGIWVVLANRVGVEGGVTFAGGPVVIAPDGETLAQAGSDEAEVRFDVSRAELRRARRPFAHVRDDDSILVTRALVPPSPDGPP